MDRTSFNWAATAWELIPYSFVVDWIFDVGNTIRANTAVPLTSSRAQCTAVKTDLVKSIYYVDRGSDTSTYTYSDHPCTSGATLEHVFDRAIKAKVQQITHNDYERFTFTRPPLLPSYDLDLNWKRMVTAVALSLQPTLRRLRKL
jgi:hypothetical protein